MKRNKLHKKLFHVIAALSIILFFSFVPSRQQADERILSFFPNTDSVDIKLYWRNDKKEPIGSLGGLKAFVESKGTNLLFGMNAGMYMEDQTPLGLYIENKKQYRPLNTRTGSGNFYMEPNGVFYINAKGKGFVCTTANYKAQDEIAYATQSGPMLLINGQLHPAFTEGSKNLNLRNGVGILPGNKMVFAMSKVPINFYDFAMYFKNLGCSNALYLDGFVSRTYLPAKGWKQVDGQFGAMIGATPKHKK